MTGEHAMNGDDCSGSLIPVQVRPSSVKPLPPRSEQIASGLEFWLAPQKRAPVARNALQHLGRTLGGVDWQTAAELVLELSPGPARTLLETHLELHRGKRKDSTLHVEILSIRAWLRFAIEHGLGGPGSVKPRTALVTDDAQVAHVEIDAVKAKIAELDEGQRPVDRRDALLLTCFSVWGTRMAELQGLQVSDLCWKSRRVRIVGKGSRVRRVHVPVYLERRIRAWFQLLPWEPESDGSVWATLDRSGWDVRGRGISKSQISRVVKRHLGVGCHALRRMGAREAIEKGAQSTMEFLGHSSLSHTARYIRTERDTAAPVRDAIAEKLSAG